MKRLLFRSRASTAARWFLKVREGDLAPREEQRFIAWLADPANADSYAACELAWYLSAELETRPAFVGLQHALHPVRHRRRKKWWRLALFSARAARRIGRRVHARLRRGGRGR